MDVDRVEDSEDLDIHSPFFDGDNGATILAKPLDSRHPPRVGKKVLPNFALMLPKLRSLNNSLYCFIAF
jgi:hypothetical protein